MVDFGFDQFVRSQLSAEEASAMLKKLFSLPIDPSKIMIRPVQDFQKEEKEDKPVSSNLQDVLNAVANDKAAAESSLTEQDKVKLAIKDVLAQLGALSVTDDDIKFEGSKIVLPRTFEGRVLDAAQYLKDYYNAQEKHYAYHRTFNYRPWDVAHAFQAAMMNNFGSVGIGKTIHSFFGSEPPDMVTINTGVNETTQVPWGSIEFPPLEATFTLASERSRELGLLGKLYVEAPKKNRKHVDAFFQLVEAELAKNSIYKGKAITGAPEPKFLDLSTLDPNKVVYSQDVLTQLDANLWSLLRYTDAMRAAGLNLKRSILVEGTYGTGKTLAGYLTAKEAVDNGWTFILCRPGQDDLFDVLKTAQLYAPAVVWFEDIDILAKGGTAEDISRLLDALDGLQGKGVDVVAGFTTNHVHNIQKGVLRPGRLDAIIEIGELDAPGYRKLVTNLIPPQHLGDLDYDKLVEAFHGYVPAYITEAVTGAMRYSIARNKGRLSEVSTDDIVAAANALRRQYGLMTGAKEGADKPTLDSVLRDLHHEVFTDVVDHTQFGSDVNDNRGLEYNEDRKLEE